MADVKASVPVGDGRNTCIDCHKSLKGEKYFRIDNVGVGRMGRPVSLRLCRKCSLKVLKVLAKGGMFRANQFLSEII